MLKIRLILIAVSMGFIYHGLSRGELPIIFNKAIRICMECVGLG